jgi:hypothetical protein
VIIAVTKSTSRSASIGSAITVVENSTVARNAPTRVPTPGTPSLPVSTKRSRQTVPAGKRLEAQKQRQQQPNLVDPDPEDEHYHEGHPAELPLALVEDLGQHALGA